MTGKTALQNDQQNQTQQQNQNQQKNQVVVHALAMAFGTFSSRILGLVRDLLFAAYFSRTVTDAWTAAFRLPNMFRRLLGEGSLSVSFIPVFVQTRVDDPTLERSRNLVNSFYTLLLIVLSGLTAFGVLFPEVFLNIILDPNFASIPGKYELTLRMARIMFSFIFFMSTYAYFMGILNALGKYALAAMAPTFFNVAMIISNFIPKEWQKFEGDALAWGVVVGGVLQMGILIPSLKKLNYLPRLSFDFSNKDVFKILRNMVPGMLGLGLLQITTIVNLRFASSLGEGPISYIYLADRLLELPLSLVSVSLGTALLPTLSAMWARGEKSKMTETANYYLRLNLFVAVPAALGLFILGQPIVEVLFERGKFVTNDVFQTAVVVQVYAFILISSSCVRVMAPAFYAIKNTWVPAVVSGISLLIHLIVAPILMKELGLKGLVSSSFVSASVNVSLLIISYYWLIGNFQIEKVFLSLAKFLMAGLAMSLVLQIYQPLLLTLKGSGATGFALFAAKSTALFVTIALGGGTYLWVSHILKAEELKTTLGTVIEKLKRKLKK